MSPCVYILASKPYGTLYTGVTSDLVQRMWQHKESVFEGFSKKYNVTRLVWYEQWDLMSDAIGREKQIKEWKRDWKINLIERENPEWMDLYRSIL
jgi:putative endonuclease